TIGKNTYEVVLCLSNKKDAYGIQRAKNFDLESVIIEHKDYKNNTNNAISTIDRLIDMSAKPYLIASALRLVIAQRLVRKLCPKC
ncbi:hypothetical protein VWM68_10610, partial [Campylobacter coli]